MAAAKMAAEVHLRLRLKAEKTARPEAAAVHQIVHLKVARVVIMAAETIQRKQRLKVEKTARSEKMAAVVQMAQMEMMLIQLRSISMPIRTPRKRRMTRKNLTTVIKSPCLIQLRQLEAWKGL